MTAAGGGLDAPGAQVLLEEKRTVAANHRDHSGQGLFPRVRLENHVVELSNGLENEVAPVHMLTP